MKSGLYTILKYNKPTEEIYTILKLPFKYVCLTICEYEEEESKANGIIETNANNVIGKD